MKFMIDSTAFELAKDQHSEEVIALVSKTVHRNLFLKKEAERLLEATDREIDFEEWAEGADEQKIRDLKDGLTLLECFGIATCTECERDRIPEVRVAGEKDYRRIAAFIEEQQDDHFGFLPPGSDAFYSEDNIRARQFMNLEYCFLKETDGQLEALSIIAMPQAETFSTAVLICGLRFRADLDRDRKESVLAQMVSRAAESFSDDYTKLRYLKCCKQQEELISCLKKLGFEEVCCLKREAYDGNDITVYDLPIGR